MKISAPRYSTMSVIVDIFSCLHLFVAISQALPAMRIHLGQCLSSVKTLFLETFLTSDLPVIEVVAQVNSVVSSIMTVEEVFKVQEVRSVDLMRKGKSPSYFGERIRQFPSKQSDQVALEISALHIMALVIQPTNDTDATLNKMLCS